MQLADRYGWLPWEIERIADEHPDFIPELLAFVSARDKPTGGKPVGKPQQDEDD